MSEQDKGIRFRLQREHPLGWWYTVGGYGEHDPYRPTSYPCEDMAWLDAHRLYDHEGEKWRGVVVRVESVHAPAGAVKAAQEGQA
jgi:hypothetical protein